MPSGSSVPCLDISNELTAIDGARKGALRNEHRVALTCCQNNGCTVIVNALDLRPRPLSLVPANDGAVSPFVHLQSPHLRFEIELRPQRQQYHETGRAHSYIDHDIQPVDTGQTLHRQYSKCGGHTQEHMDAPQASRTGPGTPVPAPDFRTCYRVSKCVQDRATILLRPDILILAHSVGSSQRPRITRASARHVAWERQT